MKNIASLLLLLSITMCPQAQVLKIGDSKDRYNVPMKYHTKFKKNGLDCLHHTSYKTDYCYVYKNDKVIAIISNDVILDPRAFYNEKSSKYRLEPYRNATYADDMVSFLYNNKETDRIMKATYTLINGVWYDRIEYANKSTENRLLSELAAEKEKKRKEIEREKELKAKALKKTKDRVYEVNINKNDISKIINEMGYIKNRQSSGHYNNYEMIVTATYTCKKNGIGSAKVDSMMIYGLSYETVGKRDKIISIVNNTTVNQGQYEYYYSNSIPVDGETVIRYRIFKKQDKMKVKVINDNITLIKGNSDLFNRYRNDILDNTDGDRKYKVTLTYQGTIVDKYEGDEFYRTNLTYDVHGNIKVVGNKTKVGSINIDKMLIYNEHFFKLFNYNKE